MALTHLVLAYVNNPPSGGGTSVDITSRIDMQSGIDWVWGRTDWTTPVPTPGTLTFTLDNYDGAFSPGNPTGIYKTGCAEGVVVVWWVGDPAGNATAQAGRTLYFKMGPPSLSFPNGRAGSSVVTVQCVDVLAELALRGQLSMYDETVLKSGDGLPSIPPYAYFPMFEPASASACADYSGYGGPPLVVTGGSRVGLGAGGGPPLDTKPTVYLQSGVTTTAAATVGATYLQTLADLNVPSGTVYDPLYLTWQVVMSVSAAAIPYTTAGDMAALAEFTTAEGVVVCYAAQLSASGTQVTFGVITSLQPGVFVVLGAGTVSTTATHCVAMGLRLTVSNTVLFAQWSRDGATGGSTVGAGPAGSGLTSNRLTRITIGSAPKTKWTGPGVLFDWVGAVGKVAVFGDSYPNAFTTAYQAGWTGWNDTSNSRVARLLAYSGIKALPTLAADGTGITCLPDVLEVQDTGSEDMLTSVSTALAGDGGQFVARRTYSVPTTSMTVRNDITAVYQSAANRFVPGITVDVETQASVVPALVRDITGRVFAATASARNSSGSYSSALTTASQNSGSIAAALVDPAALGRLAQDRVAAGRSFQMTASQVVIDLNTSVPPSGGWLPVTLLCMPGDRIRLVNLPAAVVGFTTTDQYLVGGEELYTLVDAAVTFNLRPADAPVVGWLSPETSGKLVGLVDSYWRTSGDATLTADVTASATTIQATFAAGAPQFSLAAGDYPMLLKLGTECVQASAAPTIISATVQQLTVVRGANTTNPRPHTAGEAVDVWLAPTTAL